MAGCLSRTIHRRDRRERRGKTRKDRDRHTTHGSDSSLASAISAISAISAVKSFGLTDGGVGGLQVGNALDGDRFVLAQSSGDLHESIIVAARLNGAALEGTVGLAHEDVS